ncbi:hypothetical protein AALO_G00285670 [Alosa alosa]|uniref:Ig-like domain-containing protein n=1 Tax=Alosa alosa TaxID=278164 RepID=A0AAV6FKH6_9TELE|nr:hypothetical protein AALO_G00285670 [Alosa alosa]
MCVSTNWTTKPTMEWMDSKGSILQHAGDSVYCSGYDTPLSVKRSVTVQEQHGYDYTCRVSHRHHRKEKLFQIQHFESGVEAISVYTLLVIRAVLCCTVLLLTYWITKCTYQYREEREGELETF